MKVEPIKIIDFHGLFLYKGLGYRVEQYAAQFKDIISVGKTASEAINNLLTLIYRL